jgi:Type II CAAX prenyl endopeptidase Rce1-like
VVSAAAPWVLPTVTSAAVLLYYGRVVRVVGEAGAHRVTGLLLERTSLGRRWTVADLDGVVRLLLAGVMQLGFLVLMLAALPVAPGNIAARRWDPVLLALGVPLGLAEGGLASYVAYVGTQVLERVGPAGTPSGIEAWLTVGRGGWVRYYLRTASVAPGWLLVLATTVYVAGEELVFRGLVITVGAQLPAIVVLALSVALFCMAQIFYTPGWQTALLPVLGALVIGIVHASLFMVVPDVKPLIVAHTVMFLVTVL